MMGSSDALIWNIEADPQLQSTVMAVWQLDAIPTPERMSANIDRMVASIPRLRQHVVEGRPRPTWVDVGSVDLDRHYSVHDLGGSATFDDAVRIAEEWVAVPFDRSRPLWQLGLFAGLADGKAAVVIKVHHAIADGMGMVLMLAAFTDLEPEPPVLPTPDNVRELPVERPTWSRTKRAAAKIREAATALVRHPVQSVRETVRTLDSSIRLVTPNRTPRSPLMTARSGELTLDTRTLPLNEFKSAGRAVEASINDVFVAVITRAIRGYHHHHDHECRELRVHMPVNSRTARTAVLAGNDWVPARIVLQLETDHSPIRHVRDQLESLRVEPALGHINAVSSAIQRLGRPISRWIIGGMMKGVDVLASNVPGPPFPLYLAGSQIERFVAFGPPAGASLNVTMFSYDGTINLGITSDAASVTDRDRFLSCLDEAIAELVDIRVGALAV
jgi:WS/DGAT/MGAT family acyltransferase